MAIHSLDRTGIWMPDITPGLYRDLPSDVYHRWQLPSNSFLGELNRTPAHCRAAMTNPQNDPTPAMTIGSAVHAAVLQPDIFKSAFACLPEGDSRTSEIRSAKASLLEKFPAERILKKSDYETCLKIRDAAWAHPGANKLLKRIRPDEFELSGVWIDDATGVRCKMRTDAIARLTGCIWIVDLKTTEDASSRQFQRSIFSYGYYRQAAMYLQGMRSLLSESCEDFIFIAVEKKPPYAISLYRLDDDVVLSGMSEVADLLARFAACDFSGHWGGYDTGIQSISIPPYAWKEILRSEDTPNIFAE